MSANYLKQAYLLAVVVCHVNNPGQRSHLAASTLCIRWAEGVVCQRSGSWHGLGSQGDERPTHASGERLLGSGHYRTNYFLRRSEFGRQDEAGNRALSGEGWHRA